MTLSGDLQGHSLTANFSSVIFRIAVRQLTRFQFDWWLFWTRCTHSCWQVLSSTACRQTSAQKAKRICD